MKFIETLRKPKILKMSIFDLSSVALVALIINRYSNYNFFITFGILIIIGVYLLLFIINSWEKMKNVNSQKFIYTLL